MNRKVAVIGIASTMSAKLLQELNDAEIDIVSPEGAKYLNMREVEPFILENHRLYQASEGREFICKGIHEYRKNNINEWICQCGRKL